MRRPHVGAAVMLAVMPRTLLAQPGWTHFAGGPARVAVSPEGPDSIGEPAWVASSWLGAPISFVGQSGPVVLGDRVYALGAASDGPRLFSFSRATGAVAWTAPTAEPALQSWSAPAADAEHGLVIAAVGAEVFAIDATTGGVVWRAVLGAPVANASPLVTGDLAGGDRVFITDATGFGSGGRLYCINADPFDAAGNPYQPGEIVWSVEIGSTSGNTPACAGGVVYVSTSGETGFGPGRVLAFPADATHPPEPLWSFTNVKAAGFYSGVAVAETASGRAVFAASYNFFGDHSSSNLVKLDAATGLLAWSADSNRTAATPVPLPDGRVLVSGGIGGFGTVPSLRLFRDAGDSAVRLWDTAVDTWSDANLNGRIDAGEYLAVGGWTHQPAVLAAPGRTRIIAGVIPLQGEQYGACTDLFLIDPDAAPGSAGFIAGHAAGAGSTPALSGGVIYTVGGSGLAAFGELSCYADCDSTTGVGVLDFFDFVCFQDRFSAGDPYACDCDTSTGAGACDFFDFVCFQDAFGAGCP